MILSGTDYHPSLSLGPQICFDTGGTGAIEVSDESEREAIKVEF